ncbi:hypothetical protein ACFQS7_03015 [Dankookia sp. GCM10030260]|uniref:hypothetical protein n=1 Tax=Dankookia sp. GCM10030260 TaxID=3273390 RepID=UPI00361D3D4D
MTAEKGRCSGMSQDEDIVRVAAALRAPGLKYRNFGNEPVRSESPAGAKGAVTIAALNTTPGRDTASPPQVEDQHPTMKLIAEALSPAAMPVAGSFQGMAPPAWPLLDALAPPVAAEAREAARGTLVQLFGGLVAPVGPALPPPALPSSAFAPAVPAGPPAAPALPPGGLFPTAWASQPQGMAADPAGPAPGLVPADRVTTPLADVLQNLGRGGGATNPAFAGLRLPGAGGSR